MTVTGFIQMNPEKALALLKIKVILFEVDSVRAGLHSFEGPSKYSCALVLKWCRAFSSTMSRGCAAPRRSTGGK